MPVAILGVSVLSGNAPRGGYELRLLHEYPRYHQRDAIICQLTRRRHTHKPPLTAMAIYVQKGMPLGGIVTPLVRPMCLHTPCLFLVVLCTYIVQTIEISQ